MVKTSACDINFKVEVKSLLLTEGLKQLATRAFGDTEFQTQLRLDPADALAKAEIMLSPPEMETLMSYLTTVQGFSLNDGPLPWIG